MDKNILFKLNINQKIYSKIKNTFNLKKHSYNSIIPLNVYMTWANKQLPPAMNNNFIKLKNNNPELNFFLYDDNDCREFIKNNFNIDVLNAYNSLIPGAYKADLWRYCILYINGGIYLDIKYGCVNNFKLISLTEKEYFVRDRDNIFDNGIYNALIVTLPKNEIMKKCVYKIVENVKNKYYGNNPLSPTGPSLLRSYFTNEERNKLEMRFHVNYPNIDSIIKNNYIILQMYYLYRKEQNIYQKNKHYSELWKKKYIYK